MRGPSTLEGGYSPSQYVSSAIFKEKVASVFGAKADRVGEPTLATGTKAAEAATKTERMMKLNLAILETLRAQE